MPKYAVLRTGDKDQIIQPADNVPAGTAEQDFVEAFTIVCEVPAWQDSATVCHLLNLGDGAQTTKVEQDRQAAIDRRKAAGIHHWVCFCADPDPVPVVPPTQQNPYGRKACCRTCGGDL